MQEHTVTLHRPLPTKSDFCSSPRIKKLIGKEKSRRVTFQKRKNGLLKKAKEFSILCGVDTDRPHVPEIWPPNPDGVARIINRYKNEVGTGRRSAKIRGAVVGLDEYFLERQRKLGTELAKARTSACDDLIAHLSEEEEPMPTYSFYVPADAAGLYCRHDPKPSDDQMLLPTLFQYAANDNPDAC
ncbi:hypothetical protein CRG98_035962 [Punica granatum]|uniref:MADS-box domain-containing protein n=1 Tax=Punica granatum TaxID=22663 RepID=A0A2I0II01_PUNGR|nr:hypothetical protein CRG98_035962 [Punica granatum]